MARKTSGWLCPVGFQQLLREQSGEPSRRQKHIGVGYDQGGSNRRRREGGGGEEEPTRATKSKNPTLLGKNIRKCICCCASPVCFADVLLFVLSGGSLIYLDIPNPAPPLGENIRKCI